MQGSAALQEDQVYQQIIADLKEAESFLSPYYLNGNLKNYTGDVERLRPTKWAAIALLARVYLYNHDYANAEAAASLIINNSSMHRLVDLNAAFLKNNVEAIWQLQPVNFGRNTEDAFTFTILETGPNDNTPVYLSPKLLNSFETGDQRKNSWINNAVVGVDTFYYPYKYRNATQNSEVTEYLTILRLAEQYLIRAEARAQQGNLDGARLDINAIRGRAGLPTITVNTQPVLLAIIYHERQIEFFSEWGHRWLDLKRTGQVNPVMTAVTPQKGGIWNTDSQLYPIPLGDIQKNTNISQNPGY